MADTTSTDISGNRKTIILIIVGAIVALALGAFLVPDARSYTVDMVKTLLAVIPTIIK